MLIMIMLPHRPHKETALVISNHLQQKNPLLDKTILINLSGNKALISKKVMEISS